MRKQQCKVSVHEKLGDGAQPRVVERTATAKARFPPLTSERYA
jgi:hypothetical protein